jgi:hypothetical protein
MWNQPQNVHDKVGYVVLPNADNAEALSSTTRQIVQRASNRKI